MTTDLSVYELVSKFPTTALDGSITACNIRLRTNDGWEFPIVLPSEFCDKSHAEIISECDRIIYRRLFPNRAEDERFNLLGTKIAEADKAIDQLKVDKEAVTKKLAEVDAAIEKMAQATTDMQSKVDKAVVELTELVTTTLASSVGAG